MKYIFISLTILCSCFVSIAQDNTNSKTLLGDFKPIRNAKCSGIVIDIGYMNGPVKSMNINGMDFSLLAVFNNRFATGFNTNELYTHNIVYSDRIPAVNPHFNFSTYNWRNEFIIGAHHKISLSIPIDIGMGRAVYSDEYANNQSRRVIVDANFFTMAAGMTINLNLFQYLSLDFGGRYRITTGVERVGSNMDFSNYTANATLRFKIPELKIDK